MPGLDMYRLDRNSIDNAGGGGGNATAPDLLAGKTASTDAGDIVGTMVNNGAVTISPGTTNKPIPAGYHNGQGIVQGVDVSNSTLNIPANSFGDIFPVSGRSQILAVGFNNDNIGNNTGYAFPNYASNVSFSNYVRVALYTRSNVRLENQYAGQVKISYSIVSI